MKGKVLNILLNSNNYVSGEEISNLLGVSRSYIWKIINQLRKEGYNINSISNKGYKLITSPHNLYEEEVTKYLRTSYIGRNYIHFTSIDSTNLYCKRNFKSLSHGSVIVSEEQTNGKGRLDRNWYSPAKQGLYFSLLLKPTINLKDAPKISIIAATATCIALKNLGYNPYIKWPNDIIINNKKICGILSELIGDMYSINALIVGIGLNVNNSLNEFSNDIKEKASSLKIENGFSLNRSEILAEILNIFEDLYTEFTFNNFSDIYEKYKSFSLLIDKEVFLLKNSNKYKVIVKDINSDGSIKVLYEDNTIENLLSGEISIRGLNGYI